MMKFDLIKSIAENYTSQAIFEQVKHRHNNGNGLSILGRAREKTEYIMIPLNRTGMGNNKNFPAILDGNGNNQKALPLLEQEQETQKNSSHCLGAGIQGVPVGKYMVTGITSHAWVECTSRTVFFSSYKCFFCGYFGYDSSCK